MATRWVAHAAYTCYWSEGFTNGVSLSGRRVWFLLCVNRPPSRAPNAPSSDKLLRRHLSPLRCSPSADCLKRPVCDVIFGCFVAPWCETQRTVQVGEGVRVSQFRSTKFPVRASMTDSGTWSAGGTRSERGAPSGFTSRSLFSRCSHRVLMCSFYVVTVVSSGFSGIGLKSMNAHDATWHHEVWPNHPGVPRRFVERNSPSLRRCRTSWCYSCPFRFVDPYLALMYSKMISVPRPNEGFLLVWMGPAGLFLMS